jgi:hypothetical protein
MFDVGFESSLLLNRFTMAKMFTNVGPQGG